MIVFSQIILFFFFFFCCLSVAFFLFAFVFAYLFVVGDGQGWSLIGDCLPSDRFRLLLVLAPHDKKNTSW